MSTAPRRGERLTARELEVLETWRECGGNLDAISRALGIAPDTVHGHLANIRAKAGVRRTWQAAVRLLANA